MLAGGPTPTAAKTPTPSKWNPLVSLAGDKCVLAKPGAPILVSSVLFNAAELGSVMLPMYDCFNSVSGSSWYIMHASGGALTNPVVH